MSDLEEILARLEAERTQPMARWHAKAPEPPKAGNVAELVAACFPKHWRQAHKLRQAQNSK